MKFGNQISRLQGHALNFQRRIHISEYIPAYYLKYTRFPIKPKREFPYWITPSSRMVYPFTKEVEFQPTECYELIFKTSKPAAVKKLKKESVNKYQNLFELFNTNDKALIFQSIWNYYKKGDVKPFYLGMKYLKIKDILQLQSDLKFQATRKFYSSLLYKYKNQIPLSNESDKLPTLHDMNKVLEKIRFECFSNPNLSEVLLVLECTIFLKQDPQEMFKQVLTEYQPNVSFFLLFLDYFSNGAPIDLISTCRNYHVLKSNAIQMKILDIIKLQEREEALSKSLEFVSILKRLNIKVTEESFNQVLKLYKNPEDAIEFIKINSFRIYSANILRLLRYGNDKSISIELWNRTQRSNKIIEQFIDYCSLNSDFHTLTEISKIISDKSHYLMLLNGLMRIDSPLETVRVWKQSGLLQHQDSWKWLLLSIRSRNTMTMFTDIVTELLMYGPPIPDNLSDILVQILQRIGESDPEKQRLLLQHVKEMALFHQDMDNIL
ncbi:hypothetical protein HDV06_002137 [Boothiomyces sp. JEL0866]|nr:hypothetical protein HDV06_002137 [Boothiomyces sp. JEL0866]